MDLLDPALPVLLLPVRVETRRSDEVLRVRVYPDDIHRDSHEAPLTKGGRGGPRTVPPRDELETNRPPWLAASRAGSRRAGRNLARALHRDARASQDVAAAHSVVACGDRAPAPGSVRRPPMDHRQPRPFVPSPPSIANRSPHSAPTQWRVIAQTTRRSARAPSGMSGVFRSQARWHGHRRPTARLELRSRIPRRLRDPSQRGRPIPADELESLLNAHHYTTGLASLPPGGPTNALDGTRSAYSNHPDAEELYDRELGFFITGATRRRRSPSTSSQHRADRGSIVKPHPSPSLKPSASPRLRWVTWTVATMTPSPRKPPSDTSCEPPSAKPRPKPWPLECPPSPCATPSNTSSGQPPPALGPYATMLVGTQPYGVLPVMLPTARAWMNSPSACSNCSTRSAPQSLPRRPTS